MPPVRPSDFEAITNKPEYSLGTKIVNTYVRLPILLFKLIKWITVDGTIAATFEAAICGITCEPPEDEEDEEDTEE